MTLKAKDQIGVGEAILIMLNWSKAGLASICVKAPVNVKISRRGRV